MNGLTEDWIAIDTNAFEHLLNQRKNTEEHISKLLKRLASDEIRLLVDTNTKGESRIRDEYRNRMLSYMQREQIGEQDANRILLRYWFSFGNQEAVCIERKDDLMVAIKGIISERSGRPVTDRLYVYVAFKKGRILVTNDRKDILDNREELKRKTKGIRPHGGDVMASQEAHDGL